MFPINLIYSLNNNNKKIKKINLIIKINMLKICLVNNHIHVGRNLEKKIKKKKLPTHNPDDKRITPTQIEHL